MTTTSEAPTVRTIHFQLSYLVKDLGFGNTEIKLHEHTTGMNLVVRKQTAADAPNHKPGGTIAIVTSDRNVAERLYEDACSSGQLSVRKGAVKDALHDMSTYLRRTIRLIRWRTNSAGAWRPIESAIFDGFKWSFDGSEWKPVADYISFRASVSVNPRWTADTAQFVENQGGSDLDEPFAHELLREAWTDRGANPRSAIVMGVAAAETGFKQFASKVFPETAWILQNVPSPPLHKMLTELFPWSKIGLQIGGKEPKPPESITARLREAVTLRDQIVHRGAGTPDGGTVDSMLSAVRDLLYFLDVLQGQEWALDHLSAETRKQLAA